MQNVIKVALTFCDDIIRDRHIKAKPIPETGRYKAFLLRGSRVRIPLRALMFFSCVCCVGSGLCDGLIPRSGEPYRISREIIHVKYLFIIMYIRYEKYSVLPFRA
jgi:hypothetical protein